MGGRMMIALALFFFALTANALDNGVGRTPAMGYNTCVRETANIGRLYSLTNIPC